MASVHWRGVLKCGIATGLAWSLLSVPLLVLAGGDIIYAVPPPYVTVNRIGSFLLNVVAGIWAVWLYAALRPVYGAGPKAGAIAGFSWWLIATINTWQWADIGFLRFRDLAALIVVSLPILVGLTVVGGWLYERDASRSTGPDPSAIE